MPSSLDKNIRELYIECSCLPKKLLIDLNHFLSIVDQKHAEEAVIQLTPEQLKMVDELSKIYESASASKEQADEYKAQIILSVSTTPEAKKLQSIRKYLEKCECPFQVGFNYEHTSAFHNYASMKKFFENLGMKI